jgi:hypothetical protein
MQTVIRLGSAVGEGIGDGLGLGDVRPGSTVGPVHAAQRTRVESQRIRFFIAERQRSEGSSGFARRKEFRHLASGWARF